MNRPAKHFDPKQNGDNFYEILHSKLYVHLAFSAAEQEDTKLHCRARRYRDNTVLYAVLESKILRGKNARGRAEGRLESTSAHEEFFARGRDMVYMPQLHEHCRGVFSR